MVPLCSDEEPEVTRVMPMFCVCGLVVVMVVALWEDDLEVRRSVLKNMLIEVLALADRSIAVRVVSRCICVL